MANQTSGYGSANGSNPQSEAFKQICVSRKGSAEMYMNKFAAFQLDMNLSAGEINSRWQYVTRMVKYLKSLADHDKIDIIDFKIESNE